MLRYSCYLLFIFLRIQQILDCTGSSLGQITHLKVGWSRSTAAFHGAPQAANHPDLFPMCISRKQTCGFHQPHFILSYCQA